MVKDDTRQDPGWGWFDPNNAPLSAQTLEDDKALALAAARCFRGADGEKVLAYLRAITLERALGPGAPDTLLRHLEGQRQLVAHMAMLVARGRDGG
jgi:hypothetical protein